MTTNKTTTVTYDNHRKEVEKFDKTKLGVKGLVDSGITHIPRMFHQPPEKLPEADPDHEQDEKLIIPVIDMSGPHEELVERIRDAAAKFGFFQVINHGIAESLLDRLLDAFKAFHELPAEEKVPHYRREVTTSSTGAGFYSNFDLFSSKAASWRDTLEVRVGPNPVDPNSIPTVCREEVVEWTKEVNKVGERVIGVLCEGLGISEDRLKGMEYIGRRAMVGNYYPYCPEPDKTIGIAPHTDPGILTVLVQDQVGGLQVNHHGKWLHLNPLRAALVINIGDLFQIISNDAYTSGEHRVVANPSREARVSIAVFFSPGIDDNLYGPLPELVSPQNPALYQQFRFADLVKRFLSKEVECKSITNYFRL